MFQLFSLLFLLSSFSTYAQDRLPAEAEPVSTAAGCVNVITGEFFQTETDLFVNGVDPHHISRTYDSGHDFSSRFGFRWGIQIPKLIKDVNHVGDYLEAKIPQREGAFLPYKGKQKDGVAQL